MVYPEFIVPKPSNWMQLAMNQKIRYYGQYMNKHYAKYVDKLQAKKFVKEVCGRKTIYLFTATIFYRKGH